MATSDRTNKMPHGWKRTVVETVANGPTPAWQRHAGSYTLRVSKLPGLTRWRFEIVKNGRVRAFHEPITTPKGAALLAEHKLEEILGVKS